jgi:HlyD family secretion protein
MKKIKKSKIITWSIVGVVVLAIIAVVLISSMNAQKEALAGYQTQVLEKTDITAIVGATGSVHANQTATLTWQTNGRIEELSVKGGDKVKTDQVLASLAESSLSQSIILAKSDLVTAKRDLENLLNSDEARAQAELELANARENYDKVRWYAVYDGPPRESDQDVIDAAKARVVLAEDAVEDAERDYNGYAEASENDPAKARSLKALALARQELQDAKLALDHYTNAPNTKEVSISQGEIAVAKARLDDAQREYDRLKEGTDPEDIAAAKARVAAIEATINLAKISAPFAGTITDASGKVGDLVTPNDPAFRVDDLSKMFVDVEIPEVDINRVKVGQEVTLTFDAIPSTEYQGRVSEVARIGTSDAGAVNFKVSIEVLKFDKQVMPGMTAAVNIVVSDLKDVLAVPNRAVRLMNGNRVVFLLKNGIPTMVEIEIGSSSDTLSEVVSGDVKPGDTLILNPAIDMSSFFMGRPQ